MVGALQIWQLSSTGETEHVWREENLEAFIEESGE
jgi:hypothetical protein